jgi:dTDP-4-dehydrorhamnose 3,5-epimerase
MRFKVIDTPIVGLKVIERLPVIDDRGLLSRIYCDEELKSIGLNRPIKQINHTLTKKNGTIRGLHFQKPPLAEEKLVSCLRGKIFDVAVDLRRNSQTFLQWYGEILSEKNLKALLIPQGFAHGFQTLTDDCELLYLHTAPYSKEHEDALNVFDERLNILWPVGVTELSSRDDSHPMMGVNYEGIIL